ncbi:MAG: ABC transporter ATP-binding protein [Nitrospinota bacterium]
MIRLEDVHTYFGKSHILQGVSLHVAQGETVCILGRNGVGKTTTLRTLMKLVPPASGRIWVDGRDVTDLPAHKMARLGIGYVPQGRRIFPKFTVRENLEVAVLEGVVPAERLERVLEYFPALKDRFGQWGGTLSGGEQQMLAIGRALMTGPEALVFDEPTEGLMPSLIELLKDALHSMNRRGMTILLVEQQVETALAVADRIYLMEKGAIQHEATPADLRADRSILLKFLGVDV